MTRCITYLSLWKGLIRVPVHTRIISPAVRDYVIAEVSRQHVLLPGEILLPTMNPAITHARQHAMWMLRQFKLDCGEPRYSYQHIAEAVGLTDHTTAIHGVRAHQARLDAMKVAA